MATAEPAAEPAAEPSPPTEPAPSDAPPAEAPAEPAPVEPAVPDVSAIQAELSALKATRDEERRLQQQQWDLQQRELAFLRAAMQPQAPPPPDPIAQVAQTLQITEDDLATVLSGGPNAIATVNRGLQLAAYLGAHLAEQRLTAAYQAEQARQQATREQDTIATQQREQFWSEHEDLRPHEDVVKLVVAQVAAEQGERERRQQPLLTWGEVRHEVAARTKALLGRFQQPASAQQQAAAPGAPARVRPVVGEMGGGRGRGGGRSAFDDQFGDLLQ